MTSFKILVTGATGYMYVANVVINACIEVLMNCSAHSSGGTVLSELVKSQDGKIKNCSIAGLVRGKAKAKVLSEKGIGTELFSDLDASKEIEKIGRGYDSMQRSQQRCPIGVMILTYCASGYKHSLWLSSRIGESADIRIGGQEEEYREGCVLYPRMLPFKRGSEVQLTGSGLDNRHVQLGRSSNHGQIHGKTSLYR